MDAPKPELRPDFEGSAAPPPERVTVTLDIDADILAWLKEQPTDWQREINNLTRFFMETNLIREAACEEAAGPEHEIQDRRTGPGPNAARIAHDFVP
jgi:hypothetical protein